VNCVKAGLQILNRKGDIKHEFNYLEVLVSERFEPNPTAATGFTLRTSSSLTCVCVCVCVCF